MTDPKCGEPASQRVYWPGREPLLMCETHAEKARQIGNALGCYIAQPVAEGVCGHAKEAARGD